MIRFLDLPSKPFQLVLCGKSDRSLEQIVGNSKYFRPYGAGRKGLLPVPPGIIDWSVFVGKHLAGQVGIGQVHLKRLVRLMQVSKLLSKDLFHRNFIETFKVAPRGGEESRLIYFRKKIGDIHFIQG